MSEKEELTLLVHRREEEKRPEPPPVSVDLPIPHNGNIVIQGEKERKLNSGLIVPEGAGPNYAHVVSVGPGRYSDAGVLIPPLVKPGDRCLLDAPQGTVKTFTWQGEKYKLVDERYVACVLPGVDTEASPSKLISLS